MAATPRGHIEQVPSGSFRVHVYGGTDPVTGKPRRIREICPDDATAAATLGRILTEVDQERFPPACHAVKHLYRTSAVARETSNPAILDAALRYLRQVNGWTQQQLDRYLAQARRDYERREALGPWTADYSALAPSRDSKQLPMTSSRNWPTNTET